MQWQNVWIWIVVNIALRKRVWYGNVTLILILKSHLLNFYENNQYLPNMCKAVISALHMFNSHNYLVKQMMLFCPNF